MSDRTELQYLIWHTDPAFNKGNKRKIYYILDETCSQFRNSKFCIVQFKITLKCYMKIEVYYNQHNNTNSSASSLVQRQLCPHMAEGASDFHGASLKGTNPTHDPITAPKAHLQMPSLWESGFNIWILRG